jgi:phosphoribosyl-ATP pyrophosphohydrolase/phosphoribosyl-AMP cyclohydrolase/histidinol dehydrogenase
LFSVSLKRIGIYWSRSRNELWIKGLSSGNTQTLLRVDFDCDRDAVKFVVKQNGKGFCHREGFGASVLFWVVD